MSDVANTTVVTGAGRRLRLGALEIPRLPEPRGRRRGHLAERLRTQLPADTVPLREPFAWLPPDRVAR